VNDRMKSSELREIEGEILRRCPHCARGTSPAVARGLEGAVLWLHFSGKEAAVSCEAADLQPRRLIARRVSPHLDEVSRSRAIQEELDRWGASE